MRFEIIFANVDLPLEFGPVRIFKSFNGAIFQFLNDLTFLKITQVFGDIIQQYNYQDHPNGLTNIIKNSSNDYLIIFDIDCIPLSYDFYPKLLKA